MESYFLFKDSVGTVEWTSTETSSSMFHLFLEQTQSILKHVTTPTGLLSSLKYVSVPKFRIKLKC